MDQKMLILAIDALDWELLSQFKSTPFLTELSQEGLYGRLASSPVPLTPIAFGEFYMGRESFIMPNQSMDRIVKSTYRLDMSYTIFDQLSEKYQVGLIEMPCLGKLRSIGEYIIAGLTYDEDRVYNEDHRVLPSHYRKYISGYPFYGPVKCDLFNVKEQQDVEYRRFDYINKIVQENPCDIIAIYLRIVDATCSP